MASAGEWVKALWGYLNQRFTRKVTKRKGLLAKEIALLKSVKVGEGSGDVWEGRGNGD